MSLTLETHHGGADFNAAAFGGAHGGSGGSNLKEATALVAESKQVQGIWGELLPMGACVGAVCS